MRRRRLLLGVIVLLLGCGAAPAFGPVGGRARPAVTALTCQRIRKGMTEREVWRVLCGRKSDGAEGNSAAHTSFWPAEGGTLAVPFESTRSGFRVSGPAVFLLSAPLARPHRRPPRY
jgi:hypothetical protein